MNRAGKLARLEAVAKLREEWRCASCGRASKEVDRDGCQVHVFCICSSHEKFYFSSKIGLYCTGARFHFGHEGRKYMLDWNRDKAGRFTSTLVGPLTWDKYIAVSSTPRMTLPGKLTPARLMNLLVVS